jgi:hypothetical protein
VLEQYLSEIRPLFGFDEHPALWLTERGGRILRSPRRRALCRAAR